MMDAIFSTLNSLLFLNGSIDAKILSILPLHLPIIAADGAANKLQKLEISPDYVVGDCDSFAPVFSNKTKIIKIEEQDSTDFEKSLRFAEKHGLTPLLILGMNGGEIDHILGNAIILLRQPCDLDLYFLDSYEKEGSLRMKFGHILKKKKKVAFTLEPKSLLSMIALEKTILTTHGLRWELTHTTIEPKGLLSLRNESLSSQVDFEVEEGRALLIIDIKA
jgi:thiamine pyrophosphokinase